MLARIDVTHVAVVVVAAIALTSAGFAVDVSGGDRSPVPFEGTLTTGLTGVDVQQATAAGYRIPRAEVFYSQYRYVVGYYGITSLTSTLARTGHSQQFGRPLAVFVTDFSGSGPSLTAEGYITVASDPQVGWVAAEAAYFVVESGARTPGGPAIVPFADRADAADFVAAYGGQIQRWDAVRARAGTETTAPIEAFQSHRENRSTWANRTVGNATALLDRPVSVTVGVDAPTLAAAVEQAPPNTTVHIPAGTYDANLTVEKPLTLAGAGNATRLDGGGTGTVVRAFAPDVALTQLRIEGVGANNTAATRARSTDADWDARVRTAYGYGDAGIVFEGATGSLVSNVSIETSANGILIRNSSRTVVRRSTITGSDRWQTGFMSVLTMYSPVVVQNNTFLGGRDAVYTHRADGLVVRDNYMRGMRFGVHEMYTSGTLLSNNTVRETNVGLIVMTRPTRNALVGNDVRDSEIGLSASGSASFVVGNVVVGNNRGIDMGTQRSLYTKNTFVRNGVGLRTGTIVPTNLVTRNDVRANEQFVETGRGPTRIWAADGRGNYWGSIPGFDRDGDGVVDRAFRPSGVVDSVSRTPGAATLAYSPAVATMRQFQQAVPGLRSANVVDPAPLSTPVRPAVLDRLNQTSDRTASRPPTTQEAGA